MVSYPRWRDIRELIAPQQRLVDIANFIVTRKTLAAQDIFEQVTAEAEGNESLMGVMSIEEHSGSNGERLFTVMMDEEYFPPNFLFGAGAAFCLKGVAFIKSGFSKRVEEGVKRHERYHLENGAWSCDLDLHPIIRATFEQVHELETVLFANVMEDPLGTIQTGLEIGLKLPSTIALFIKHVKNHVRKVLSSQ